MEIQLVCSIIFMLSTLPNILLFGLWTHWGRDNMDAISQWTFANAFSSMKMFEFRLKFRWSLFLKFQLTINQHWFRYWLGAEQATSHYLTLWWPSWITHICLIQPQWVNSDADHKKKIMKSQRAPYSLPMKTSYGWSIVSNKHNVLTEIVSCLTGLLFPQTSDWICYFVAVTFPVLTSMY